MLFAAFGPELLRVSPEVAIDALLVAGQELELIGLGLEVRGSARATWI